MIIKNNKTIVMGIDPGFAKLGYAFLKVDNSQASLLDCGIITTQSNQEFYERLEEIVKDINILINQHQPDVVGIEELFFSNNAQTAAKVYQARGAIAFACFQQKLEIKDVMPNSVKLNFCGDAKADKKQIIRMVEHTYGHSIKSQLDDIADAIAIAHVVGLHYGLR